MRLLLSPGQASDMTAVPQLLAGLPIPATVVADRGYDSNAVIDLIRRSGAEPSIPSTSQRSIRRSVDIAIYRRRNLVERFFCKLKHFRRVATRFDKLARNFLAAVLIASTRLWLRAYEVHNLVRSTRAPIPPSRRSPRCIRLRRGSGPACRPSRLHASDHC